ncbi:DNA primase [Sphingomonas sp. LY160]|uniref:DNA primase n=1 Tax=Sphingomonas sp. LY160 TaxID=3095342 RepID=UPI002ADECD56|nr:DNA primase [Sphingomonas sp. LY160]MEA1071216.1 DNA primase [Sphingomonas sp. LY160]
MTLSPQFLDELRARTTLSAIIAPSVKLTKAGREFKACCPFHNEKTPSFYVNDEKHFYHCFGCGAHGDAIRFLTDARGLPFMDAVKELAGKAGIDVPAPDPRAQERQDRANSLHDVMAAAQAWFVEQLDGVDGGAARAYLKQRGISPATRTNFGFGFAPDTRGKLKSALASFGVENLVEAGLLIAPDDNRDPYDRFRGRLTYPIKDQRGRVIAFSARILGAGEPKYLNSPDTPLFDKGRSLFNIDLASPASRKAGRVLVVEGQMDVIALDQAGIGEVVAPLGTAVTEAQLERLWRLEPAPIFCFDGDSAGVKAAVRAAVRALPHLAPERTLRFVALPSGQDPDDLVRSGGRAAMEELLAKAEPLVERLWRHEVEAAPLDTPEARAGLKARLIDHAATIADPSLRQLYRDEWLQRFDALVRPNAGPRGSFSPRAAWKKGKDGRFAPPPPPPGEAARAIGADSGSVDRATARALVLGHALFPQAIHDHVEALAALPIDDRAAAIVRDRMVDLALAGEELDRDALAPILMGEETGAAWRDVSKGGDIGFSFTQRDCDPGQARRDLAHAMEALMATREIDRALASATQRLKAGDDTAFEEQQRLHASRGAMKERLANLAGNE